MFEHTRTIQIFQWPVVLGHVPTPLENGELSRSKHPELAEGKLNNAMDKLDNGDYDIGLEEVHSSQAVNKDYFNSMFTLSLQAEHNLSQAGVDAVIASASTLVDVHVKALRDQFMKKLEERNIDPAIFNDVAVGHGLSEYESASKRQSHIERNLPYVGPREVVLGTHYVTKNGMLTERTNKGYIIPFEESLKCLLEMPEVWHHVQNPRCATSNEFMLDICDGQYMRTHPLFTRNPRAIQIALNTDDLEIVNPLGSHIKKHKVTIFYYTITNIPPQYRSRLTAIQPLAVAKTKQVRVENGLQKLLHDFITVINMLSSGGLQMQLHNTQHITEGALVLVPADTHAAHRIGEFKEGVSFAVKNCRNCKTSGNMIATKYLDSQCNEKNHDTHVDRCAHLDNLSKKTRTYWSKLWGINNASCLLEVKDFPLSQGLVQDPMHLLLEGVVRRELANVLNRFIYAEHYFTLQWFNTALTGFSYSYLHTSTRPEPLEKMQIDGTGSIKQTSSATLTVVHVLAIVIGSQVPEDDEYWMNYFRLSQIVLLRTFAYCSKETSELLRILIALYLQDFKKLYPEENFTPKMHYMLHLPKQMIRYGPTQHHWCMRYEGKHGFFKRKKYRNFKNLPYSMAKQHQLHMCYRQAGPSGNRASNFLYDGDCVGQGDVTSLKDRYPAVYDKMCQLTDTEVGDVYITPDASIHGLQYKQGCALVAKYDNYTPFFVGLRDIVVHNQEKFFIIESAVSTYKQHIACYTLELTGHMDIVSFLSLKFKWPLSVYSYKGETVVMNCHSHCCHIL